MVSFNLFGLGFGDFDAVLQGVVSILIRMQLFDF